MNASTKMLAFVVNDMLTFAQISKGKFRKNCGRFDIREAVEEILLIQREKAEFMEINLKAVYIGFKGNFFINTD